MKASEALTWLFAGKRATQICNDAARVVIVREKTAGSLTMVLRVQRTRFFTACEEKRSERVCHGGFPARTCSSECVVLCCAVLWEEHEAVNRGCFGRGVCPSSSLRVLELSVGEQARRICRCGLANFVSSCRGFDGARYDQTPVCRIVMTAVRR